MIKFKTIQTKIKLLYYRIIGKIKKIDNHIEINHKKNKLIQNILIIFPIKEEAFRVALYTFRNLFKDDKINYYFLVNNLYMHHFHLSGNVFNFNVLKGNIKIDETFFEDRIINKEFDMIVDLNNDFFYDMGILVNDLKSYYKVGFKNYYSDYFYNIQFDLSKSEVLEDGYKKIHLMLS